MCSGLGLGHVLRGNTPKHASKHTKHPRKTTMHHIAKHANMQNNITYTGEWVRGVHVCPWWAFMGVDGYGGT